MMTSMKRRISRKHWTSSLDLALEERRSAEEEAWGGERRREEEVKMEMERMSFIRRPKPKPINIKQRERLYIAHLHLCHQCKIRTPMKGFVPSTLPSKGTEALLLTAGETSRTLARRTGSSSRRPKYDTAVPFSPCANVRAKSTAVRPRVSKPGWPRVGSWDKMKVEIGVFRTSGEEEEGRGWKEERIVWGGWRRIKCWKWIKFFPVVLLYYIIIISLGAAAILTFSSFFVR
mmetsp:Transcript_31967/g.58166  ORF Transcript_31967/g.58166 Transcript_31967/m.58166 type:complete len:232 (+) Transcript_31967:1730-2425(+)